MISNLLLTNARWSMIQILDFVYDEATQNDTKYGYRREHDHSCGFVEKLMVIWTPDVLVHIDLFSITSSRSVFFSDRKNIDLPEKATWSDRSILKNMPFKLMRIMFYPFAHCLSLTCSHSCRKSIAELHLNEINATVLLDVAHNTPQEYI